jgi:hypothetical protein
MLKYTIDTASFELLNDVEKTFYAQAGEGYQLQVEGATDKSKLDEFRATNVDLLKQQEAFKGVDLAKYRELEEQERKLRDKVLIEAKDFDGLIAERTNSMKSDYEAKIEALTGQNAATTGNYNNLVSKYEIGAAATKAFGEHKINPEMSDDVMVLVRNRFSIDNGQVVAKDDGNILTGANGNLTVAEYVGSLSEGYKIQSSGGKGSGNEGASHINNGTAKRDAYAKLLG